MRIKVRVKPNSKVSNIEKSSVSEYDYLVKLKSKPKDGEANRELVIILSEFFNVLKQDIKIILGHKSKNKIIEINDKL